MIIEIFGKDFCPYCDRAVKVAQQFVQETEHKYEYFKLDRDFTREELFSQFPGARTFPQIRVKQNHIEDGEIVGGYTEFESYIREEKWRV